MSFVAYLLGYAVISGVVNAVFSQTPLSWLRPTLATLLVLGALVLARRSRAGAGQAWQPAPARPVPADLAARDLFWRKSGIVVYRFPARAAAIVGLVWFGLGAVLMGVLWLLTLDEYWTNALGSLTAALAATVILIGTQKSSVRARAEPVQQRVAPAGAECGLS